MHSLFIGVLLSSFASISKAESCRLEPVNAISLLTECSKVITNRTTKTFSLNPVLIKPWSQNAELPCPGLFSATFVLNGKTFKFLGVDHISPPVEIAKTELQTIKRQIQAFKPDKVMIEMPSQEDWQISIDMIKSLAEKCDRGTSFICPESSFSAIVSKEVGAEVFGGEPAPRDFYPALAQQVSMIDIYGFESARVVLGPLTFKKVPQDEWGKQLEIEIRKKIDAANGPWSYDQFKSWLKLKVGKDASPEKIKSSWIEPRADKEANFLQQISSAADGVREPLLLKNAEKLISLGSKTMMIYGASHFFKQRAAFENALGTPQIECLKQ